MSVVHLGGTETYILLLWLFVLVISGLMFLLSYLFLAMRRAMERERMSLDFSLLAIEGLESERRRVARELHDSVLPLVREDPTVSGLIRSICTDLMPPDFTRVSLKESFVDLCVQFARRSNIECVCFIEEDIDFSSLSVENSLHLYRIIQEAFTNTEKHSRAGKASLVVRRLPQPSSESILVCVSDDGRGLARGAGEGHGMKSIRQRAVILGAALAFKSESGNGFMVRVEIPTPPPPDREEHGAVSWVKLSALSLSKTTRLCAKGSPPGLPARAAGKWPVQPPPLPARKNS
ncbi:MAG: histidine kinase [Treponema sp.]|jgi:signal transduction histidine kinase|nr:histidine kinase [Treponema sp.]